MQHLKAEYDYTTKLCARSARMSALLAAVDKELSDGVPEFAINACRYIVWEVDDEGKIRRRPTDIMPKNFAALRHKFRKIGKGCSVMVRAHPRSKLWYCLVRNEKKTLAELRALKKGKVKR